MATLTSWVKHLTTDVDSATEGMQVAGEIYPMVGTEGWLLLIGVIAWLAWHVATGNSEAEEQKKLEKTKFNFDIVSYINNFSSKCC
jgi:hypothetical protein